MKSASARQVPIIHFNVKEGDRDRNRRVTWALTWPGAGVIGGFGAAHVALGLTAFPGIGWLGAIVGTGIGLIGRAALEPRFRINNSTTSVFLTFDPLKRLLGREDVLTLYPPGPHICYPQEQRFSENTISLDEATVEFEFLVLCPDGALTGSGSFRLSADQKNPVAFQRGVAAVAEDLRDLIIAVAVEELATKKVVSALKTLPKVNDRLYKEFVKGTSRFEKRFGVEVGDVTIGQLLPSEELQKTLTAQTEAAAIAKGTAIMLGYTSMGKVKEAVEVGKLNEGDVKDARDRFLSVSGNLEGMDIKRNELVLSAHGIPPELAGAITALAANAPAIARALQAANKKGSKK
jgi:hypothetical protein